jgi:hypothetical protein
MCVLMLAARGAHVRKSRAELEAPLLLESGGAAPLAAARRSARLSRAAAARVRARTTTSLPAAVFVAALGVAAVVFLVWQFVRDYWV